MGQDLIGENSGDFLGECVSLSADGHILAVGMSGADNLNISEYVPSPFGGVTTLTDAGKVKVFSFYNNTWNQIGGDIWGEYYMGRFGGEGRVSLSSDGQTIAIGTNAHIQYNNGNGYVKVFNYSGSSWNQIGSTIVESAAGRSVSISGNGNIVSISGGMNDTPYIGYIKLFENIDGSWIQLGETISNNEPGNYEGFSTSLNFDGTILATANLGSGFNSNPGDNYYNPSESRIYSFDNGWNQLGADIIGEDGDDYTHNVRMISINNTGDMVAISGEHLYDSIPESGFVRVYKFDSIDWNQLGNDVIGNEYDNSAYVSISGSSNTIAVGSSQSDVNANNSGHVSVFDLQCEEESLYGCTDIAACNYNSLATDDDGSCIYPEENYDCDGNCLEYFDCFGTCGGTAVIDNCGVCDEDPLNDCVEDCGGTFGGYLVLDDCGVCGGDNTTCSGCTDFMACNFDLEAVYEDGSCEYPEVCGSCSGETDGTGTVVNNDIDGDGVCDADEIAGCQEPEASNYDINATDSGICIYIGCINSSACNYDPIATIDDGSCDFTSCLIGCMEEEAYNFSEQVIFDDGSCIYPEENYDCDGNCLPEFEIDECGVCDGNGPVENYDCDGNCLNDIDGDGICNEFEILGCTYESACNYNPDATDDDGSCEQITCFFGCTDEIACNFNLLSIINDGSCEYPIDIYGYDYLDCNEIVYLIQMVIVFVTRMK